jgi:hypothetical protein
MRNDSRKGLREVSTKYVQLYDDADLRVVNGDPIAFVTFESTRYDLSPGTVMDYGKAAKEIGRDPVGDGWNVAVDGTLEQRARIAWYAFGGPRSPVTIEQLQQLPASYRILLAEACLVFCWEGSLCSGPRADPFKKKSPSEPTSEAESSLEVVGVSPVSPGTS